MQGLWKDPETQRWRKYAEMMTEESVGAHQVTSDLGVAVVETAEDTSEKLAPLTAYLARPPPDIPPLP